MRKANSRHKTETSVVNHCKSQIKKGKDVALNQRKIDNIQERRKKRKRRNKKKI